MNFYRELADQSAGGCFTPCPPFHRICVRSCSPVPWYEMQKWKDLLATNGSFRAHALEYFKSRESVAPEKNNIKLQ
jgi:hypothetical protein